MADNTISPVVPNVSGGRTVSTGQKAVTQTAAQSGIDFKSYLGGRTAVQDNSITFLKRRNSYTLNKNNTKEISIKTASKNSPTESEVKKITDDISSQIVEKVTDDLDISEDELNNAMQLLGLTAMDLLNPANLSALYCEVTGNASDPQALVLNADFTALFNDVSQVASENDANPATMLVLLSGIYGMNTNTHIALCDIQMFAHIPNLIYLAPASKEEYRQMFKFATTQKEHPVAIRVPVVFTQSGVEDTTDYSVYNKNKVEIKGSKVAIFTVGAMLPMALETAKKVKEETGLEITVINPRFLTGLDEELLTKLKENHELVITLEDGELIGGYGQTIASFYGDMNIKVKNYGISKAFHTDFKADELLAENGMSVEQLTAYIKKSVH